MLHLASKALMELLYPLPWTGVFIPVLPARLIQALEVPCPYIVGIERRYERAELPDDDFVLVDLDQDEIESTTRPTPLPRQQRRKLTSLLQLAAPHHNRYGVPVGPPAYAIESYPFDAFASENPAVFDGAAQPTSLAKLVNLSSASFGEYASNVAPQPPLFNAFLAAKADHRPSNERPATSSTSKGSSPPSPRVSPISTSFPPLPLTPISISRNDSGSAIQASLREKRSGHFDNASKRSSTYGFDRVPTLRRPSMPLSHHAPTHSSSLSMTTISTNGPMSTYAPSMYAQSTLAASTVMPHVLMQPVRNTETTKWVEGHCLQWRPADDRSVCSVCEDKAEEGIYRCTGCAANAHPRCAHQIHVVCPAAFHPQQIRAAFVRCFASLFYTYRKYLEPATGEQKKEGMIYHFNMNEFLRSLPHEHADYMHILQQTQGNHRARSYTILELTAFTGFNEFIHERETKPPSNPAIMLFDQVILSKRNRGRTSLFSKSNTDFLSSTSDHLWRSAAATPPKGKIPGEYRAVVTRSMSPCLMLADRGRKCPIANHSTAPAKLDITLMKEPRAIQGVPRINTTNARRKPIPSMLGPSGRMNGLALSPPS
jgi:hypothetical protein